MDTVRVQRLEVRRCGIPTDLKIRRLAGFYKDLVPGAAPKRRVYGRVPAIVALFGNAKRLFLDDS